MLNHNFNFSHWRQLAVVFLAGVLVLVTTACGAAQAALPTDSSTANSSSSSAEGMYPYKDTDMNTRSADAKADRMIREADQRIQQGNDQSLKERVEEVGQSAKQAAQNIGKSTQRAAENAQENLDELGQNARGVVNGAADRAKTVLPNQSADNPYRRADPAMPGDMTDNRTR